MFRVHFAKCNVTIKHDWVKLWDEAEQVLGGKIEILCNNAGVPRLVGEDEEVYHLVTHHANNLFSGGN